jgi:hypothetical protein
MTDRPRRPFWRRILDALDDALPMSPQDRDRRDDDGRDHSAYRKRRLRLRLLEKRGKGGYR